MTVGRLDNTASEPRGLRGSNASKASGVKSTNQSFIIEGKSNSKIEKMPEPMIETKEPVKLAIDARLLAQKQEPNNGEQSIQKIISSLSQYVQNDERDLNVLVDPKTGQLVINVVDSKEKRVLRQIYPNDLMAHADQISRQNGLFFNDKS